MATFTAFLRRTLQTDEFDHYSLQTLRADLIAGVKVAGFALPLALAFGLASGTGAPSGLITAILASFLIDLPGGAPYQISGPTGATAAILFSVGAAYGIESVWLASLMAGIMIFLMGIFNLTDIINFIPSAVIVGFLSSIGITRFIGQIDNLLGIHTPASPNSISHFIGYFQVPIDPSWSVLGLGLLSIAITVFWPRRFKIPSTLIALAVTTMVCMLFVPDAPRLGHVPQQLILDEHLIFSDLSLDRLNLLFVPALSIAILCSIENLLSGQVATRTTGISLRGRRELVAQGVGNIIVPFFGGTPATALVARTSLAIHSGGKTRMTSVFHALSLLGLMMVAAPLLEQIPLTALAGILIVTAWRINDWTRIRRMFTRRFKSAIITFLFTITVTLLFNLASAVLLGVSLAALIFIYRISQIQINVDVVSPEKMRQRGYEMHANGAEIYVLYVIGPIFFGGIAKLRHALNSIEPGRDVILSLRSVPLIDTTGIAVIEELIADVRKYGGEIYFAGLTPQVLSYLERAGTLDKLGTEHVFWGADQAIVAADQRRVHIKSQSAI